MCCCVYGCVKLQQTRVLLFPLLKRLTIKTLLPHSSPLVWCLPVFTIWTTRPPTPGKMEQSTGEMPQTTSQHDSHNRPEEQRAENHHRSFGLSPSPSPRCLETPLLPALAQIQPPIQRSPLPPAPTQTQGPHVRILRLPSLEPRLWNVTSSEDLMTGDY